MAVDEPEAGAQPVSPDLPAMLRTVAQAVGTTLGAWWVELWTFMPERDTITCRAFWSCDAAGDLGRDRVGTVIGLAQSRDLRQLVLTGRPTVRRVDDPDLPAGERKALEAEGCRIRVDYPLILNDRILGILSVADARGDRLATAKHEERLGRFCRLAASALDAVAVVERQEERMRRLVALLEPDRSGTAALKARGAVERLKDDIATVLPGVELEVEVFVRRDDGAFARAVPGAAGARDAHGAAHQPDALARQALERRLPEQSRPDEGTARLVVPLVVDDRATGYIELVARSPRRFRREEVELVGLAAGQVAVALRNARVRRALENKAATDSLTGLYSGWYFHERLAAEVARARRYGQPLALMLAELDDVERFSAEGDTPSRDDVVRSVARLVRSCLRDKVDVACYQGAGRFAVLLPSTLALGGYAGIVADRVCQTVADTPLRSDESARVERCTVSVAVAGFPAHAEDAEELIAAAEAALTAALRSGGDRVVVAGES